LDATFGLLKAHNKRKNHSPPRKPMRPPQKPGLARAKVSVGAMPERNNRFHPSSKSLLSIVKTIQKNRLGIINRNRSYAPPKRTTDIKRGTTNC